MANRLRPISEFGAATGAEVATPAAATEFIAVLGVVTAAWREAVDQLVVLDQAQGQDGAVGRLTVTSWLGRWLRQRYAAHGLTSRPSRTQSTTNPTTTGPMSCMSWLSQAIQLEWRR